MKGSSDTYDVAVIGYGPVGQALAAMLAARGHSVVVAERWPELFPLPRAGHVDAEIMRILQALGVAEEIAEDSWKLTGYELRDSEGDVLHSFEWGHDAPSGWYSDYSLFQPQLEALLHRSVQATGRAELLRGWQAEQVTQDDDGVTVTVREGTAHDGEWSPGEKTRDLRARYLVGCDGANSIVRSTFGLAAHDFGFEADWLVVFAEPNDPALRVDMPDVAQLLDPARPTTAFRSSGKRFCRWEFMLMPGETAQSMSSPEVAWGLIERWGLNPGNARLVRNTVFRFRSLVADEWQAGRTFVAGDAAHLMPPFLGQGMCSGFRDAISLAWKLHLVLDGDADPELLGTYGPERRAHVSAIVEASLRLGEIISITDPVLARERDERMRTGQMAPPAGMPGLTDGVLHRGADGALRPPAGALSVQGTVRLGGRSGLLDDLVGAGWALLVTGADPDELVSPAGRAVLDHLGAAVVRIEDEARGDDVAADLDGRYGPWFAELGVTAVLVRPDFYIFGAAADAEALDELIADLRRQLGLRLPAPSIATGAGSPDVGR
jgi:2-polyprenyl-6-methoxyphenol hydroxylase-like FAD-dependent oxidoreductase